MKTVILILVAALIVLHQDFWNWDSFELKYGFMPVGLLYHIGLTIAASMVWLFVCTFGWPKGIDDFDEVDEEQSAESPSTEGGQS